MQIRFSGSAAVVTVEMVVVELGPWEPSMMWFLRLCQTWRRRAGGPVVPVCCHVALSSSATWDGSWSQQGCCWLAWLWSRLRDWTPRANHVSLLLMVVSESLAYLILLPSLQIVHNNYDSFTLLVKNTKKRCGCRIKLKKRKRSILQLMVYNLFIWI